MTTRRYQLGFFLSVALTVLSFGAVWAHSRTHHLFPTHLQLLIIILVLAVAQLAVQLVYFIHLGRASKVRDLLPLALAASLIIFIVGGSLWIMSNLAQNHGLPYNGSPSPQSSED